MTSRRLLFNLLTLRPSAGARATFLGLLLGWGLCGGVVTALLLLLWIFLGLGCSVGFGLFLGLLDRFSVGH